MKIAFDVSYVQKARTGIGRYTTGLLQALLSRDRVNEYILHGWSYSIDADWLRNLRRENVRLSIARIPGQIKRLYWNHLRIAPVSIVTGKFDIFHSADPLIPPVGTAKSIMTIHDLAYVRHPEFFQSTVLSWDRRIRMHAARASAIIVPSEFTRQEVVDEFRVPPDRVWCVRPPCDQAFSAARSPEDDLVRQRYALDVPFLLSTGTIEPRKNLTATIAAFEQLVDEQKIPHHLVVVGKTGWKFEETLSAIGSSKYRSRIHHLNFIPDADLASIYRMADLFVYPSWYEGHGSPVVEAMASGTPVVTSNRTSLPEVGAEAVLLADPADSRSIADAMAAILSDESIRKNLRTQGLERARRFSSGAAATTLLELYRSLT